MADYQNKLLGFLMDKKWSFLRHLFLIIPLATTIYPDFDPSKRLITIPNLDVLILGVYKLSAVMFISAIIFLYVNYFYVVPKVLFKNKYLLYSLCLCLIACAFFLIQLFYSRYIFKGFEKYVTIPTFTFKSFIDNTLNPLVFLGATTGYKIFKKWIIDTERLNELKNSQLKTELDQLKNQVNPHFLFNTLNNLDTLIQTDINKASQVVHGLSDVLRYQIYDSNKEMILLSKDIDIIAQLLLLEKIRRDKFTYEILLENDIDGILVPPLLFTNFIDNALKHSLDSRNVSYVKIKFGITDKQLVFFVENSKPSFIIQREKGGLGLKNSQRRLELLYDKKFNLQLSDLPNQYIVNLKIPL